MSEEPNRPREGACVVVLPPPLYLGSMLAGAAVHWFFPLSFAAGQAWRLAAGLGAIGAGAALILAAFALFRRMGQDPNPRTETPAVTRKGPYRYTRNPMYVGLTAIQLGVGLALGNGWILILLLPTWLIMHYGVVLREEAYLEQKFGDEYRTFQAQVRRWL